MNYSELHNIAQGEFMAGDQRGWYRDWWRRKTGYVERARFRLSEAEVKADRHRLAWRRNWLFVLVVLVVVIAARVVVAWGR